MPKYYSQGPVVPSKKIAAPNPIEGPALGNFPPLTTDQTPAEYHGQGSKHHVFGHAAVKGAKRYGTVGKHHNTKLKLSGHPKAHRIGG